MATFRIDALGETPARLRSWLDRARKATAGRSAPARYGLLAATAGGVAVAGWLALWSMAPAERVYLAGGPFRPDDLTRIERSLRAQNIDYRIDGRRVSVAGRSAEAAAAAVAKLDVGPRSPAELREGALRVGLVPGVAPRPRRARPARAG